MLVLNKRIIKKGLSIACLLLLLLLTFFRENLLLAINANIAGENYHRAFNYWFSEFFRNQNLENLLFWKWMLTISFASIMSLVTILGLHFWFHIKKHTLLVVWIYFIYACLIGTISFIAYLFSGFNVIYPYIRMMLGAVLSPVPFFSFFAIFYFFQHQKEK